MTEENQVRTDTGSGGDEIARLLRLAGPRPAVPEDRAARVRHNVKAAWREDVAANSVRPHRWFWLIPMVATAAAVMFLLIDRLEEEHGWAETRPLVAKVLNVVGGVESGSAAVSAGAGLLPATTLVTADEGSFAALRLAGGALVRVDSGSRVRVESGDQLTLLRGRLYADSGVTATSRIEVRTSGGVVTDVGTQFSVAQGVDDVLTIGVREGSVRFIGERGRFLAEAGTELSIDPLGEQVESRSILRYGAEWRWILEATPPLEIEGRTLGVFLEWVERETGWKIELPARRPDLRDIVLFGTIEGLRPDEAPAAVLPTCGLDFDVVEGVLQVLDSGG